MTVQTRERSYGRPADGLAGKETWSAEAEDVVTRSVADGRTFQVAKLRLDPLAVTARLADLGWAVQPVTLSAGLFALRAHPLSHRAVMPG